MTIVLGPLYRCGFIEDEQEKKIETMNEIVDRTFVYYVYESRKDRANEWGRKGDMGRATTINQLLLSTPLVMYPVGSS